MRRPDISDGTSGKGQFGGGAGGDMAKLGLGMLFLRGDVDLC